MHLDVLVLSAMYFGEEQLISEYLSETRQQKLVKVYNSIHPFDPNSHYVTYLRGTPFHTDSEKLESTKHRYRQ
jgi:outer membrane protein assembly factor BamD (BamD/ComL family)